MPSPPYESKFAEFLRMCRDAKQQGLEAVVVRSPEVLGDDYEELVESLNRLSDAGLALMLVPRDQRSGSDG